MGRDDSPGQKSKFSSGNDTSGFESKIKPVSLNDTNPLSNNQKKSSSTGFGFNNSNIVNNNYVNQEKQSSGSGIAEQISDNYDDDDFDQIGGSGSKLGNGGEDDFFADNKNAFGGGFRKEKDKSKNSDKESDPSGLGFDDNYDDAFI